MLLNLTGEIQTHDPTIIKENNVYYRIQTGNGIPVFKSEDLKNWESCGSVFLHHPEWVRKMVPLSKENDYWAPDCVYRNGEYRIYYSVSSFGKRGSAIGLCTFKSFSDLAEHKVTDCGLVICSSEEETPFNAIDPQICSDGNGNDYLTFGSFWAGIQQVPLNEKGFVKENAVPSTIACRHIVPDSIEGGFIYRRNNLYYLFASHDFCCRGVESTYKIIYGMAEKIEGPYFDEEGRTLTEGGGTVLRNGESHERWAGPGHNSIFEDDDGKTYIVYHAYDRENKGRPALQIEEITWKNDWPCLD